MESNQKQIKNLANMSPKELLKLRQEAQKKQFELKMKHAVKGLKQTHQLNIARKNIARINTFFKLACDQVKKSKPMS